MKKSLTIIVIAFTLTLNAQTTSKQKNSNNIKTQTLTLTSVDCYESDCAFIFTTKTGQEFQGNSGLTDSTITKVIKLQKNSEGKYITSPDMIGKKFVVKAEYPEMDNAITVIEIKVADSNQTQEKKK